MTDTKSLVEHLRFRSESAGYPKRELYADAASEIERLCQIEKAAAALLADVYRRYPGEALRCPYMIALDKAMQL